MADEGEEGVPPAAMVGEAPTEDFGLPAELMAVLPSDPFAQLDVARKITSIALSHRLGRLEAEELRERVEKLDSALAVATGRLRRAEEEKETLLRDNSALSNTVRKLNRDVAKLEVFKKTLVQSLQEDDSSDNTAPRASVAATSNFSAPSDEDSAFPTSKSSQISETASSVSEENSQVEPDAPRPPRPHVFLPSYNSTPRRTPPDSPPRRYASVSPPRRHSISVTSMNMFNDRSSGFSSQHSSPFDPPSQTGRTRVDGKEFFRHVRNRLSYEQFGAFLANVKELNAHRQTREDTLRKADEIFGPENKDLYTVFESLITRNIR
uniref:At4g15545-like C-terminal domain-containing protein n=1 Tax=Zea mays TaxID=4577 RepID=A0A804UGG0_MAIZE